MNKIQKTIATYFKDREGVVAVVLFGSHAQNRARAFSDVDIGILARYESLTRIKNDLKRFRIDLSRVLRKDIHLVLLNQASENLLSQIFDKGCCLTVNDSRTYAEFKMNW